MTQYALQAPMKNSFPQRSTSTALIVFFLPSFVALSIASESKKTLYIQKNIPIIDPIIKRSENHHSGSFTQGWIKDEETFYESSGMYGRSFVQHYSDKKSITVNLPHRYFAEGLTLFNNMIYLLTWKEETLFILDKNTLQTISTLAYSGEGWGLTHNGSQFIMSNGSADLFFRDADDFSISRRITVPLPLQLNELEYVNGVIWANDWNKDDIYAIDSTNGCLLAKMDLSALRTQTVMPDNNNVLNGIAYDSTVEGLWVTGKYWPTRYLIEYPNNTIEQLKSSTRC
jgi:glutaminyl-peptide cyclotransferase